MLSAVAPAPRNLLFCCPYMQFRLERFLTLSDDRISIENAVKSEAKNIDRLQCERAMF